MLYQIGEKIRVKHVVVKDFGERYYDSDEMSDLFTRAGFSDTRVKWCSFAHINMIDPCSFWPGSSNHSLKKASRNLPIIFV